jgi:hypothetical protein
MENYMKCVITLLLGFGLSTIANAADLNQNALQALLATENIALDGDVHSDETVTSIYDSAIAANAKINNICIAVKASPIAKCTLWITYSPIGETAIEYTVNLPGTSLATNNAYVSRGD